MLRTRAWIFLFLFLMMGLGLEIRAGEQHSGEAVIFPVVLSGSSTVDRAFGSTLHLMNLSTTTSVVAVRAVTNRLPDAIINVAPDPGPSHEKLIRIRPNHALRVPLRAFDTVANLKESWVGVEVLEGAVDSSLRLTHYSFQDRHPRSSDVMVPGSRPAKEYKLFAAWEGSGGCFPLVQSGYAFVNPHHQEEAEVKLFFTGRDNSGLEIRAERKLRIPPLGRVVGLLGGLFDDVWPPPHADIACLTVVVEGEGTVTASSNLPIGVEALEVNLVNGYFVDLPRRPLPRDDGSIDE